MRLEATGGGEEATLRSWRHFHGLGAGDDKCFMERVIEILGARRVARQAGARRDRYIAKSVEREVDDLVVNRRQERRPFRLALRGIQLAEDGVYVRSELRRVDARGRQRRVVLLVGSCLRIYVAVRVVGRAPGRREHHVEVAGHPRRIEIVLAAKFLRDDVYADDGEIRADVVLDSRLLRFAFHHDELERLGLAGRPRRRRGQREREEPQRACAVGRASRRVASPAACAGLTSRRAAATRIGQPQLQGLMRRPDATRIAAAAAAV